VFVRSTPTIAMAAATVADLSSGRFILGLGSSHKVQVEAEHGVAYSKPLTRVRETVEAIRDLWRDGRVSYRGETIRIDGFDLWFSPRQTRIPIYLSAVFPKMTALCGEIADGLILTRSTLVTAAAAREGLAEGARRAGRDPGQVTVTSLLPAAVADTREAALGALRPGLAFYMGFFPRYNRMIAEQGFAAEAQAIADAWSRGDRDAAIGAVTDAVIDATSVAGTPEQCRERVEAYRRSGLDVPILSPFARGTGAKAKFEAVIRACAPRGAACSAIAWLGNCRYLNDVRPH
jgi:alkanesulfonate monooxygenase SsuD/methylene tetrahydromethanopterin reductase-like flavin-dependent oxidoreductase (luciferase family)